MLSPRDYTPRRRLVMTLVVWTIFGGTIALAAWATKHPNEIPAETEFQQLDPREVPFDQRMLRHQD